MPDSSQQSSMKTIISTTQVLQTPEDAELGARVRTLVHRVLDEAEDIMDFGSHTDRMLLMKSLLGPAGRLIGVGAGSQKDEARVAFQELMSDVRSVSVPVLTTLVTDHGIDDVAVTALPQTTYDQDEVNGDEEV